MNPHDQACAGTLERNVYEVREDGAREWRLWDGRFWWRYDGSALTAEEARDRFDVVGGPYYDRQENAGGFEFRSEEGRAWQQQRNAGNITAYWRGFTQYHFAGRATTLPKMCPLGSIPIRIG